MSEVLVARGINRNGVRKRVLGRTILKRVLL